MYRPRVRMRFLFSQRPRVQRHFTVLALESSADDTCAAVVSSSREILSNVVVKQHALHEGYGGIHPTIALEAHQCNMVLHLLSINSPHSLTWNHSANAVRQALSDAGLTIHDIDGIAFTRGPGMAGCLSVASNAAKSMAAVLNKPLVGVHHMQAHALTPFLTSSPSELPQYPFLTLLVSGGHTLLLLATSQTSFRILATTADESIGRSFDKVSRLLGLRWAGIGPGAALEQFCAEDELSHEEVDPQVPSLPRPMRHELAFSYSGLHSTVERYIFRCGGIKNINIATRQVLARNFQTAAVAQLSDKLSLGLKWCEKRDIKVRNVVVSGGVASNKFLRESLHVFLQQYNPDDPVPLVFPPPSLCSDNAAMIAWASMHRFLAGDYDDYSIRLRPVWKIDELTS